MTRRELLARSIATSAGLGALTIGQGLHAKDDEEERDPSNWILWSDPHIDAIRDRDKKEGSPFYMFNNFAMATKEVLAKKRRPAGIFINGDLANLYGILKFSQVIS